MNTAAMNASSTILAWTEQGLVPDSVIRAGIRRLCRQRLNDIQSGNVEIAAASMENFVAAMNASVVAPLPQTANEQHYELPPEFFSEVLGRHGKYSCCWWGDQADSLDVAERQALEISCARAGIENGMSILDLGCGWGSLSLWIAEKYPGCAVTSVSNSAPQGECIRRKAAARNLQNLQVITADMNDFEAPGQYDRIVSVEMFEHMRNYRELFRRISTWLRPEGRFFMHIFCHRSCAYEFLDEGPSDWMGRHFFSGGIMPSDDLPLRFQEHLRLIERQRWDGRHYQKTANAWLANMDSKREKIMPLLIRTYGASEAGKWFQRWRIFFMACAELFGHENGQEWFVSHYTFSLREGDHRDSRG